MSNLIIGAPFAKGFIFIEGLDTSGYLNLGDNGRLYFLNINANRMAYIDTLDKDKVYPMQNPGHFLNVIDEYVYRVYLDSLGMFKKYRDG